MNCLEIKPKYENSPNVFSDYIQNELLSKYSKSTQNFYLHLVMCIYSKCNLYIPIPETYIRKYFRTTIDKSEIKKLVFGNFLIRTKYDKTGGFCREYSIPNNILYKTFNLLLTDLRENSIKNLGLKRRKYRKTKELFHYKNGNLRSILISKELKRINPMIERLLKLKKIEKRMIHYQDIGDTENAQKAFNDLYKAMRLEINKMIEVAKDEPSYEYTPEFKISKTGRIFEVGEGVQTLPSYLKEAMYGNKPNFHNYDIRSCHMAALAQEAGSMGIDVTVLEEYISNPNAKYKYAEQAGIDVKTFKTCLLSLLYGAESGYYGTPFKVLKEEYGHKKAKEKLTSFKEAVKDILKVQEQWIAKLPEYIDKQKYKVHGKWYLENAAELRLDLENDEDAKCNKFLTAFIMQGLEAGFIAHITILSDDYDYKIIMNMHDGVITEGKIPEEAIIKARELSGFKNAILEIKPF